ncbi:Retrovirus-related Pol polyprotein from transposon [Sesamum angolense]|uniref:Retrovirus-related Pol polyprotein from transposon n=1 Tax=Sesamum angolense TaxID=2727404 RepID=A0AAE1T539_9LAMI|nr:Retrovirus-related Pol polyprotein from transposon [Sesamum angolense]
MVIRMGIVNLMVNKVLFNHGSSVDILFMDVVRKMEITVAWDILNVDTQAKPVKQKKRSFGMERNRIIEKEVNKLLKAKFSNVVVVPKAVEKWRMCMDFTDLNKACPMDPYPLPQIELLVDSTTGFVLFSMMNAYQGYHQIFIAEEDRNKTSFITENDRPLGVGFIAANLMYNPTPRVNLSIRGHFVDFETPSNIRDLVMRSQAHKAHALTFSFASKATTSSVVLGTISI